MKVPARRASRLLSARGPLGVALLAAGVALGGFALAQPPGGGPGMPPEPGGMMMFGGPGGPGGPGGAMMMHHLDGMLDGLNATPAQRARVRQIAMAAEADLRAQQDAGRALRDRAMRIFTAPTVDAGAAESLRQEMSAQQDQASRRVLDSMLEISKVLTPEQRAKIGARMQDKESILQDRRQRMEEEHRSRPMPTPPPGQKP